MMDVQVKTSALVEVLKLIALASKLEAFPAAPTITFINDDYTIIGNVTVRQFRLMENSSIDWEYQNG